MSKTVQRIIKQKILHSTFCHIETYSKHLYISAREAALDLLKNLVFVIALIYFSLCFHQILSIVRNHGTVLIKKNQIHPTHLHMLLPWLIYKLNQSTGLT